MNRYLVTLNWHGELMEFHISAKNKHTALRNAMTRLAKILDHSTNWSVRQYFNDGKDRWKVERR